MIFNYDDFILGNIINESRLYYSPRVRKVLNRIISDPIAKDLAELETTDLPIDVTFVDIDDNKEGFLTFTTMKSAEKYLSTIGQEKVDLLKGTSSNPDYVYRPNLSRAFNDEMADENDEPYKKSRNPVRLGKFVNNLLPNKYGEREREAFVNKFKAGIESMGERFILVDGEDINHYYWYENYKRDGGSLNSSCMRDEKGIFELYVDNPEVCRLLVLLEDELVIGRALVWKLSYISDTDAEYFMDRQYTVKESDVEKFREYANKEGWAYKSTNSHSAFKGIVYKGVSYKVSMEVEVNRKDYNYFPYMDTFLSYNHYEYKLVNASMEDDRDFYILDDTSGGYRNEAYVWSSYEEDEIDRDEAVWSDPLDDWLSYNKAVEVTKASDYRNKGYWPIGHEDIVYDEWNDEEIHVEDAVYSEEYEYYLYDEDAISVINELEENGDANEDAYYIHEDDVPKYIDISDLYNAYWYKCFMEENELNNWDNHKGIMTSLLSKDYKGEPVPDVFLIDVYKIDKSLNLFNSDKITDDFVEKFKNIDMLSEIDAKVFDFNGINYDEDEDEEKVRTSEKMDKWTYRDYIKPIRNLLIEELKRKIEEKELSNDWIIEFRYRLEELEEDNYEEEQKAED